MCWPYLFLGEDDISGRMSNVHVKNCYVKKVVLLIFVSVISILAVVSKHSEAGAMKAVIKLSKIRVPNRAIMKQLEKFKASGGLAVRK
jgi:uncharacterized membrane protein